MVMRWYPPRTGHCYENQFVCSGHTFCTTAMFDDVAAAHQKTAFVTSQLPVIVSLEMHCTPQMQRVLAMKLIKHLGDQLISV
jgi:phosphatidylinositol phospholipase C, delta